MLVTVQTPSSNYGIGASRLLVFLICASSGLDSALSQSFVIDTNQSSITISGTVLGSAIMTQSPGSLTASIGGTLQAAGTGASIQFTGQNLNEAKGEGGWAPRGGGHAGPPPRRFWRCRQHKPREQLSGVAKRATRCYERA